MLYRPWRNHEGQMTLFQQILRNPDVFNFGDHHHHAVAMEVLKHQPENMDNRELSSWKSLELIDTLLALAEAGHSMAVQELFSFPSRNCPDVLTLGLMQINPPMTNFRLVFSWNYLSKDQSIIDDSDDFRFRIVTALQFIFFF